MSNLDQFRFSSLSVDSESGPKIEEASSLEENNKTALEKFLALSRDGSITSEEFEDLVHDYRRADKLLKDFLKIWKNRTPKSLSQEDRDILVTELQIVNQLLSNKPNDLDYSDLEHGDLYGPPKSEESHDILNKLRQELEVLVHNDELHEK